MINGDITFNIKDKVIKSSIKKYSGTTSANNILGIPFYETETIIDDTTLYTYFCVISSNVKHDGITLSKGLDIAFSTTKLPISILSNETNIDPHNILFSNISLTLS